jgi:thiamine-phosphate pyrophosphorylase
MSQPALGLAERLAVYLIADFTSRSAQRVLDVCSAALAAGVTAIQYRDKSEASPEERVRRARALGERASRHGALYVVNDDLELALAVGAEGVHLGPHDLDPRAARRRGGSSLVIGGSAGTLDAALAIQAAGVDYLGVGAIYEARTTKEDASPPRGPEVLARLRARLALPLVAIGGIDAANAAACFRAGADGVALVRAILDADDPAAVVRALWDARQQARAGA